MIPPRPQPDPVPPSLGRERAPEHGHPAGRAGPCDDAAARDRNTPTPRPRRGLGESLRGRAKGTRVPILVPRPARGTTARRASRRAQLRWHAWRGAHASPSGTRTNGGGTDAAEQGRGLEPLPAHHLRRLRAGLAARRGARGRLALELGPLLPPRRRPGWPAFRGLDDPRGDRVADHSGDRRLPGPVDGLPQPGAPRADGEDARPRHGGHLLLGLGAGWAERDDTAYGSPFGTAGDLLRHLERGFAIITGRWAQDPPVHGGAVPILIGGGERVTLRLVARYADLWNGFGPLETFARKNRILDDWRAGRARPRRHRTHRAGRRAGVRSPGGLRRRGRDPLHLRGRRPLRVRRLGAPRRLARRACAVSARRTGGSSQRARGGPVHRGPRPVLMVPHFDQRPPDAVLAHEPPDRAPRVLTCRPVPGRRAARRPAQRQSHRRDGLPARLTSGATSSMSTSARDGRRWRRHRPPRDRDDGGRPSRSHDRPCGSLSSRVRRRAPEVVPERGRLSSSGSRAITGTRRGCYVRRAGSRRSPGRVLCRLHDFLRHLRVGFDDREPVGADPRPSSLPPCVQA